MEHITLLSISLFVSTVLCAVSTLIAILLKRENSLLARQLTETTVSLELTRKQMEDLQEKNAKINEFQDSLHVAELTTKLQKPRLNAQNNDATSSTFGKYSNIKSLTKKGMSVEQIASVLSISTHEAHQLINLSKLAQGNFADNVAG